MSARRLLFPLLALLIVAGLLGQPAPLEAQCSVINTVVGMAGTVTYVYKVLAAPAVCMNTAMNASFCTPTAAATFMTAQLRASAMSATTNPFCSWSCDCGIGPPPHVVIGTGDGLPVELMEFSVEDESAAADAAGEEGAADGGEDGAGDESG